MDRSKIDQKDICPTWIDPADPAAGLEGVPNLHEGLRAYVLERRRPGHFLASVAAGDLFGCIQHGDEECVKNLPRLVAWFYCHTPGNCCGSWRNFHAWTRRRPEATPAAADEDLIDAEVHDA